MRKFRTIRGIGDRATAVKRHRHAIRLVCRVAPRTVSVAVQVAPALAPVTWNTAGAPTAAFSGVLVTVPEVQLSATGTVAAEVGMKFLFTVIEAGAVHPAKVMGAASVTVTSVVAKARPT